MRMPEPEPGAFDTLRVERRGPVGWLIFDRPDAGNAMNARMMDELERAWRVLDADPEVRVIVNTGEGRAFQTGLDMVQLARDPAARPGPAASALMCPICLTEIRDWDALGYWRYGSEGDYEEIRIPADVNPTQRARYLHGAYVRCPASQGDTTAVHHLPAR